MLTLLNDHLQAEKQREAELAATASVEETEDAEDEAAGGPPAAADGQPQPPIGNGAALPAGLTVRRKAGGDAAAPAVDASAAGPEPTVAAQQPAATEPTGSRSDAASGAAAGPAAAQDAAPERQQSSPAQPPQASAAPLAGLEIRAKRPKPAAADGGGAAKRARHGAGGADGSGQAPGSAPRPASQQTDDGPRLLSRAELAARQQQEQHAAGLDADLDALARARRGAAAEAEVRIPRRSLATVTHSGWPRSGVAAEDPAVGFRSQLLRGNACAFWQGLSMISVLAWRAGNGGCLAAARRAEGGRADSAQ